MPKYLRGKKVIQATEKAYNVIYKSQGYKPLEKDETQKELESLTVDELRLIAKEKGIEGYSKMKKDELIAVIEGE
ncbi:Rho termination factor N-terminal domain-containing protein [Caloranaerobacter azorensis]|uniref:Rho termination factor N-terminal domain-containing protein n=1 Tax=Caloranaerobacter azorensis TaxID=116090 RepID=UPI00054FEBF7|nr:Rho termination factor N-terminal domain-containing protein [Caloranaerobacter azorensis]